ncbi:MAG: hypothetical protein SVM86_00710 [Candidatus Cloacimonadota bacterium]|nr:hypothetical protein [Candidatus Cloacimonadota bacterium]
MNTSQMLLVMVAMVLFSSLFINSISNISDHSEIAYKAHYLLQGHKIAERYFEKIEAEMLGGLYDFDDILVKYAEFDTTFTIQNSDYYVNIETNLCNLNGNIDDPQPDFQRIDIRIECSYYDDILQIGTTENPLSKVFADMEL